MANAVARADPLPVPYGIWQIDSQKQKGHNGSIRALGVTPLTSMNLTQTLRPFVGHATHFRGGERVLAGAAALLLALGPSSAPAQQGSSPGWFGAGGALSTPALLAQAPLPRPVVQAPVTPTPTTAPSPLPIPTPAPSPTASPSPLPSPTASPTTTPSRDPDEHINYRAERLPQQARINVAAVGLRPATVTQLLAPNLLTGVYGSVPLPTTVGQTPAPAVVNLTYDPVRHAGKVVFVQPLSGGTIDGSPGGRAFTLDDNGVLAFTFQAPARPRPYQISVRLDNVETGLRFTVFDPAAVVVGR